MISESFRNGPFDSERSGGCDASASNSCSDPGFVGDSGDLEAADVGRVLTMVELDCRRVLGGSVRVNSFSVGVLFTIRGSCFVVVESFGDPSCTGGSIEVVG